MKLNTPIGHIHSGSGLIFSVLICFFGFLVLFHGNLEVDDFMLIDDEMFPTNSSQHTVHPFPYTATVISLTILLSLLSLIICLGQGL